MRKLPILAALVFLGLIAGVARAQDLAATTQPTDLSGQWRFAMDPSDTGVASDWFAHTMPNQIQLPGILQAQGYGDEISTTTPWVAALPRDFRWYLLPQYAAYTKPGNIKVPYLSQPPRHYLGVAWYQRDITIPPAWEGMRVHLFLERPRWETRVWVDENLIGSNNSLCAPHEYDLGILPVGNHQLTIRADNRMLLPYRPDGHSVSDALGATWNGIAGRIELSATTPVWIDDAQVFPNVADKTAMVKIHIGNLTGQPGSGTLSAGAGIALVNWDASGGDVELHVPLGDNAQTWDEFHPVLQHMSIRLKGGGADDERDITFGLRQITAVDNKMLLNGREINLRGTHDGGDFPLTGYPATDVESWKKIIQLCKDYGLNSMRFHSWCPPDAAFTAADELGFYLQPECGMWNSFNVGSPISLMLEKETARIMKANGIRGWFLLSCTWNVAAGNWQPVLEPWAAEWFKKDPRRLYAANTGRSNPAETGPQYAIAPIRSTRGWFGGDFRDAVANAHMPVISHEVGQWCAYPDFGVINEFTGYLQPGNYEIFRDSAAAHGVLDQNKEFAFASGKFQVECYKEECEANLRTPGLSGYQLLDLHDYLGQGTALIGVVDAFWRPKGYVTAAEFHRFSGPVVPLARLYSRVFKTTDKFGVDVEIANYGADAMAGAQLGWKIIDQDGTVAAQGNLNKRDIPIGKNIPLGKVSVDLSTLAAPREYKLDVSLAGTDIGNDWNFWLYPAVVNAAPSPDVLVTTNWSDALARLKQGSKVLFTPPPSSLGNNSPPLDNVPVFWNRLMNPKVGAMMGLLCDAKSAALAGFPTDVYCDWEWTEIVKNMKAINIDKAPAQLRPIVQAIDDWNRNYRLGVVFECNVDSGRLVVCAADIQSELDKRLVARQLRRSLLDYMASDKFKPTVTLSEAQASGLFPGASPMPTREPAPQALPGDVIENPTRPTTTAASP